MRAADVVVIAARWQPWSAARLDKSLSAMALPGQVIVIGSKGFEPNRRALLKFEPAQVDTARKTPDAWSRESSTLLEQTAPKGQFVNLLATVCPGGGCPLFTDHGELISYDGLHLTPAGVAYVAKFIFDQEPLGQFVKSGAKAARQDRVPGQALQDLDAVNIKETE